MRIMSAGTSQRVSNYIGGAASDGSTDDVIDVVNPATAEVIGAFAASSTALAVDTSARETAWLPWSRNTWTSWPGWR